MNARLRKLLGQIQDAFWVLPALCVLLGIGAAQALLAVDRQQLLPRWLIDEAWLYNGSGAGARTLLGAIASSTIGVAGTVFSITIAALSLAAGQMGPRLLRNFTRDRGVQITLGVYLGTFSYALMVLRAVRTVDEGSFTPHAALSAGLALAFGCVGMLVYFVGHMAGRINVDTVIDLVSQEVGRAVQRLAADAPAHAAPPEAHWQGALRLRDPRHGYLHHLDADGLADWAAAHGVALRLRLRPGGRVFQGAVIADLLPPPGADAALASEAAEAIRAATALHSARTSDEDLEYAVRQLVEVAVRALSPGINDPHTAISALDRLGDALCALVPRHLPDGVRVRDGRVVLVVPEVDYDGLLDAMFNLIRQNAGGSPAVLIRLLEVLAAVAECEHAPARLAALRRHADTVLGDALRGIHTPADRADLHQRHAAFVRAQLTT